MSRHGLWARVSIIVGLVAMLIGVIDPLEGSLVILAGNGMALLGALLGSRRHRGLLIWSFVMVAAGVGALWGLSALGGIGGSSGRSNWWGLVLLPYPVGWFMGIVGVVLKLREPAEAAQSPAAQ
jgi:hypothetical protein